MRILLLLCSVCCSAFELLCFIDYRDNRICAWFVLFAFVELPYLHVAQGVARQKRTKSAKWAISLLRVDVSDERVSELMGMETEIKRQIWPDLKLNKLFNFCDQHTHTYTYIHTQTTH